MVEKNFPQAIYGEILAEIESLLHALSNSGEDSKFDEYRPVSYTHLTLPTTPYV